MIFHIDGALNSCQRSEMNYRSPLRIILTLTIKVNHGIWVSPQSLMIRGVSMTDTTSPLFQAWIWMVVRRLWDDKIGTVSV